MKFGNNIVLGTCRFLGKSIVSLAVLLTISAIQLNAAPGDFDFTFGTAGKFHDNPSYAPCYGMLPNALALQADGKILVVGKIYNQCSSYGYLNDPANIRRVLLRRYLANGLPDDGSGTVGSFGMNGFAVGEIGGSVSVYGEAFDVAVQLDGRIVVVGSRATSTGTMAAVWRFTSAGELDDTFGTDGLVTFATEGTYNASRKVVVLGNGKILIAGYSGTVTPWFVWLRQLTSTGVADTSFGTSGKVYTGLNYDGVGLVVNSATGHIYVGGKTGTGSSERATVGKRYGNGNNFGMFGNVGKVVLPDCVPGPGLVPTYPIAVRDIALQSTGSLLVTSMINFGNFATQSGVFRVGANGLVDANFGDPAQPDMCNKVMPGSSLFWTRISPNDNFYSGSARFFPNGPKDTSFNAAATGLSGQIRPTDGKIVQVAMETVLKANQSGFDSRIKLFRLMP